MGGGRHLLAAFVLLVLTSQTSLGQTPSWSPKTDGATYDPTTKDWSSVITACRAAGQFEKRLLNFWVRSAFHDSMAVDVSGCVRVPGNSRTCPSGGIDTSLFLSLAEMTRPENSYDNFSAIASRATVKIAAWYDISVADCLAVCSIVSIEELSKNRVAMLAPVGKMKLRIGRLDSYTPAPPNLLPAADAPPLDFYQFWNNAGFSMKEAMALLGSHSLIDDQDCFIGPDPSRWCDPSVQTCSNLVRMFRWENHYFNDICTPTIDIQPVVQNPQNPTAAVDIAPSAMTDAQFASLVNRETCKWSSSYFQGLSHDRLLAERQGLLPPDIKVNTVSVDWSNSSCEIGPGSSCPHPSRWFYTIQDAFFGKLCQASSPFDHPALDGIRDATRSFLDQKHWDDVLPKAMIKMVTSFARWSQKTPISIFGFECPSGYVPDGTCATKRGAKRKQLPCSKCDSPAGRANPNACDPCCRCLTAFRSEGFALRIDDDTFKLPV